MNHFAKLCRDQAKLPWGKGWELLTDEIREALIARQAVAVLLGQCDSMEKFQPAKDLVQRCMGWKDLPEEKP